MFITGAINLKAELLAVINNQASLEISPLQLYAVNWKSIHQH